MTVLGMSLSHVVPQHCRDVNETLLSETETFGFKSETRLRPRPSVFRFETRPRPRLYHIFSRSRQDRDVSKQRIETEISCLQH